MEMSAGLVIIGSGPAGVSTAEAFREHDSDAPVRIMTDDADPPYWRPPLSKEYLRGTDDDVELHSRDWYDERAIEIHRAAVSSIDVPDHAILIGDDRMQYDALVLACGSEPTPLSVPGGERALPLRSLADARRLRQAATAASSAVVVGAGFIGCEVAASLASRGLDVTLVGRDDVPQLKRLGSDVGHRIRDLLVANGVRFIGGASVTGVDGERVHVGDDRTVDADVVLAATGVKPRTELARAAGLDLHSSRIVVAADTSTSADDVYAAGDIAFALNATAGRRVSVEHWQDAADQGEVAGARAAGVHAEWTAVPGFWSDIGDATLKYHAWGDGYDTCRVVDQGSGFTAWYERDGVLVGVLTMGVDSDYDLGEQLIEAGKPAPL